MALPEQGLWIAVEIADGSGQALSTDLLEILDFSGALTETEITQFHAFINPQIENSRGLVVGEIRASDFCVRNKLALQTH